MSKVAQAVLTLSLIDSGSITITWDAANGFGATMVPGAQPVTGSQPPASGSTSGSNPPVTGSSGSLPPVTGSSGSQPPATGSSGSQPPVSGSYVPIYAGFAHTGHSTAPVNGSGILTPAEPAASAQPQGQTFNIPALAMPTVAGQTYVDPVFGTTVRRLPDGMRHAYSQLQAFSDDETLMLTLIPDGGYHVIRYPSMATVALPAALGGSIAPRWLPNSHRLITTDYGWSTGGAQLANVNVRVWDCDAGTVSTLFVLPQFVRCSANIADEQFSWDGQWMSLYGIDAANVGHACVVNLHTGQLGASIPVTSFAALDWVGVSPLGNYMLVNSNGTSNGGSTTGFGLEVYDIRTGVFIRRLYNADSHLDHGLDAAGNETVLTTVLASQYNNNNPGIVTYNIATGAMTQKRQVTWAASPNHMSMQGAPGAYVLDSSWAAEATGLQPFEGEVYVLYGDGSTRRLAHHRCNPGLLTDATLSYFCQAQATASRSGRLVAFATNWNTSGQNPQGFVIENLTL